MPMPGRLLLFAFLAALPALGGAPARPAWFLAGERIYREGRLPSGAPLQGVVKGDIPVPAEAMTCAHCHMWSGLGTTEGGVYTPPVHAPALFQPRYQALPRLTGTARERAGLKAPPLRPAYTDATLAEVLRGGLDPTGRELSDVMPRYQLEDADMALLIRYLHALSAEPPPGVDATTLHLATLITPEVKAADRRAMLKPLQDWVAFNNRLPRSFDHRMFRTQAGRNLIQDHRALRLSTWVLTGAPATWARQLESHYRRDPVFAFVGGISDGSWAPIHAFCEAWRIPCILPLTDFPVISDQDWYTLYFTRGYVQEGEAAARFLAASHPKARVLQVVQGEAGRRLAEGFATAWRERGGIPPITVRPPSGVRPNSRWLGRQVARVRPDHLVVWGGPEWLSALPEGLPTVVPGGLWGERVFDLPEGLRPTVWLTYPFRHPEDDLRALRNTVPSLSQSAGQSGRRRIASRMYSLVQVLSKALAEMEGAYYRDNLFDRIAMLPDQSLPDFERLGFGPGQRYASKGCYLMQVAPGAEFRLVKRSDWVVP